MEKEGQKEEKVNVKKISPIELDELKRLHEVLASSPDRKFGTINLKEQAMKNVLDYHEELAKKYEFDPRKIGINRHTGDLQMLPEDKKKQEDDNFKGIKFEFRGKEKRDKEYDPLSSREIGYRSARNSE